MSLALKKSSPPIDKISMIMFTNDCQEDILPIPNLIIEVTGALIGKKVRMCVIGWLGFSAKKGVSASGIIPKGIMKNASCWPSLYVVTIAPMVANRVPNSK